MFGVSGRIAPRAARTSGVMAVFARGVALLCISTNGGEVIITRNYGASHPHLKRLEAMADKHGVCGDKSRAGLVSATMGERALAKKGEIKLNHLLEKLASHNIKMTSGAHGMT